MLMKNCLLIVNLHGCIWNKITNMIDLTSRNQGFDKQKQGWFSLAKSTINSIILNFCSAVSIQHKLTQFYEVHFGIHLMLWIYKNPQIHTMCSYQYIYQVKLFCHANFPESIFRHRPISFTDHCGELRINWISGNRCILWYDYIYI